MSIASFFINCHASCVGEHCSVAVYSYGTCDRRKLFSMSTASSVLSHASVGVNCASSKHPVFFGKVSQFFAYCRANYVFLYISLCCQ